MKDKVRSFKKKLRKVIISELKTLKGMFFQKCKICFSEPAIESCSEM